MRSFKIEKDFMIEGYRCVILGLSLGHRCGYVGLPKDHDLYGKHYDDINIEVHGGLTYCGDSEDYPVENKGFWWIGFDCAHYMDGKDVELINELNDDDTRSFLLNMAMISRESETVKTMEYVENELRDVVNQLIRMTNN